MIAWVESKKTVLNIAAAMKWMREEGPNRGQSVEAILKSVGLAPGNPWCAAFVSWVGRTALGKSWPLPMVGGCATLGEAANRLEVLKKHPLTGSIFLIYKESLNRFNHTGFILEVTPDYCRTIEGNTSPDGSPEGTGVFERVREFDENDRFIYWWDIVPKEAP